MESYVNCLVESMFRFIGQTVTIFTTSGGLSGNGFTGVLLSADCNVIRLLADIGAPPACPVGSSCTDCMSCKGIDNDCNCFDGNPLGAICVIPRTGNKNIQLGNVRAGYIFPHTS